MYLLLYTFYAHKLAWQTVLAFVVVVVVVVVVAAVAVAVVLAVVAVSCPNPGDLNILAKVSELL